MICREELEDTLKSLRLIPVDEVKLTLSKMVLALVFSILIYLLLFAITFLVEAVLHFEALSIGLVFGKPENISSGRDWCVPCHFSDYRFGGSDEKGLLAGAGIC